MGVNNSCKYGNNNASCSYRADGNRFAKWRWRIFGRLCVHFSSQKNCDLYVCRFGKKPRIRNIMR